MPTDEEWDSLAESSEGVQKHDNLQKVLLITTVLFVVQKFFLSFEATLLSTVVIFFMLRKVVLPKEKRLNSRELYKLNNRASYRIDEEDF